jgi:methylenetetrahydrofolate reductase (NADPH)
LFFYFVEQGRWGDSASPAFGELSTIGHFYAPGGAGGYGGGGVDGDDDDEQRRILSLDGGRRDPTTPDDVAEIFARYVEGRVPHIPWSEGPLQAESFLIQGKLARLNRAGFFTINSQPAVNGAPASHKVFGWGPGPNGRVYQRAYCEGFCSPQTLGRLRSVVQNRPNLALYATTTTRRALPFGFGECAHRVIVLNGADLAAGDGGTDGDGVGSSHGTAASALTWGVFPNREVVQPTIFDPATFFGVWSEEAFSLWTTGWMRLYDPESDTYELLETLRDTYYLCAIVDNDYYLDNDYNHDAAGSGTFKGGESGAKAASTTEHPLLWDLLLESA